MEILVAVAVISVVEIVVLAYTLRAVEREDDRRVEIERVAAAERARSRFVTDASALSPERISLEAMLARLESHVRSEQQAAESFLKNPTAESLHHHPQSPFHVTH